MEVGGIGSSLIIVAFVDDNGVNVGGRWKRSSSHGFFCGKISGRQGKGGLELTGSLFRSQQPACRTMATNLDPRALVDDTHI